MGTKVLGSGASGIPNVERRTYAFTTGTAVANQVLDFNKRFRNYAFLFKPSSGTLLPAQVFVSFNRQISANGVAVGAQDSISEAVDIFFARSVELTDPVDALGVSIIAACPSGTLHVLGCDGLIDVEDFIAEVSVTGTVAVSIATPPSAATSKNVNGTISVIATSTGTEILAANTSRRKYSIYNPSASLIYLGFAENPTSAMVRIPAGGSWEEEGDRIWRGAIRGLSSSGTVDVYVAEFN